MLPSTLKELSLPSGLRDEEDRGCFWSFIFFSTFKDKPVYYNKDQYKCFLRTKTLRFHLLEQPSQAFDAGKIKLAILIDVALNVLPDTRSTQNDRQKQKKAFCLILSFTINSQHIAVEF